MRTRFWRDLALVTALFFVTTAADCFNRDTSSQADKEQRRATELLTAEAQEQVGMPDIVNFTERRFAKQILELRDTEIATYTYTMDMNGQLHFLCESVGYGLPYSVQYTNPEYIAYRGSNVGIITLPQPDPSGLFMPQGLSATWVLCADKENDGVAPIYFEPELIVSPFRLRSVDSYQGTQ